MEKMIRKITFGLVFVALLLSFGKAGAQIPDKFLGDPKYGKDTTDRIACLQNISIYREYYRQRNYNDAIKAWRVVIDVCPQAKKTTFVDGVKMYGYFAKKERDPIVKDKLVDTLLSVYDKRIEHFKEKGKVLGYKGLDYIKFRSQDLKTAYDIFAESVSLKKEYSSSMVLYSYFMAAERLFQEGTITADILVNLYAQINDYLEQQKSDPKKFRVHPKNVQTAFENVEKLFANSGAADCDKLVEIYEPKFNANKQDIELLKKITQMLTTYECTESKLFTDASESLYAIQPSATAATNIAKLYLQKANYEKAIEYYTKSIELETDDVRKSNLYVTLGTVFNTYMNKPIQARDYARQAIKLNPNNGEAYILIGAIYAAVTNYGENPVEKNSVYWLAVDYFVKAKSKDKSVTDKANEFIKKYKSYYPKVVDVFDWLPDANSGDKYVIKGWINETTTIRPRAE